MVSVFPSLEYCAGVTSSSLVGLSAPVLSPRATAPLDAHLLLSLSTGHRQLDTGQFILCNNNNTTRTSLTLIRFFRSLIIRREGDKYL